MEKETFAHNSPYNLASYAQRPIETTPSAKVAAYIVLSAVCTLCITLGALITIAVL